jgi:hypothetical protein
MKLAVIASGGQQWNFEADDPVLKNDSQCNGHDESTDRKAVFTTGEDNSGMAVAENGNGGSTGAESAASAMSTLGAETSSRTDPVHEICRDLQVKIADLGNACWVVRCRCPDLISWFLPSASL